jgi:stage III sporulation protein SpoIIIAA
MTSAPQQQRPIFLIPDEEWLPLYDCLPKPIQRILTDRLPKGWHQGLLELVLDLGRPLEGRFMEEMLDTFAIGPTMTRYKKSLVFEDQIITQDDLDNMVKRLSPFMGDNRSGLPKTLHRISAVRNRQGGIVGLTCRIGRAIEGTLKSIEDMFPVDGGPYPSVLFLGAPGVGKTTRLREMAQLLANQREMRVMIIDTSNEIGGDGDIPHAGIGRARRLQVASPDQQARVMIEAVENHTPEVIIVDEIGTLEEAEAARTIAERGVMLIATAHGRTLDNLIKNPTLSDLVGGIQSVTLSDEEARRRGSQKSILEREKPPTFQTLIELRDRNTLAIYHNVSDAVDRLLRGEIPLPELRQTDLQTGVVSSKKPSIVALPAYNNGAPPYGAPSYVTSSSPAPSQRWYETQDPRQKGVYQVFAYGVSSGLLLRTIQHLQLSDTVSVTKRVDEADAILSLRNQARPGGRVARLAQEYETPLVLVGANTMSQLACGLYKCLSQAEKHPLFAQWQSFLKHWQSPTNQDDSPTEGDGASIMTSIEKEKPTRTTSRDKDVAVSPEVETEALQEVQTAIETVLKTGTPAFLAPQPAAVRRLQHELIEQQQGPLRSMSIGREPDRRICISLSPMGTAS